MGWIIFVFVLLVVLSSMRGKAKKAKARSMQSPALLQGVRSGPGAPPATPATTYPPAVSAPPGWTPPSGAAPGSAPMGSANAQVQFAQSMKMLRSILSGTMPAGTVFQPGNSTTYQPGNAPVYAPGNPGTYRPGDSATYAPGDSATYAPGNSAVYGGPATYAPGDSPTYAPVGAVGYQPVITPPAQVPAPPATNAEPPPVQWQSAPDEAFQPAYATLTEMQTARRDQAVIDRDRRRAARTAPEQAPFQGSTAISSTALNTTLATPYQPTSLVSSLSSSLSSSLTDSPPRSTSTTAFLDIQAIALPDEITDQVRFHLRNGHEVEAVRLVCDSMNVGLLEATKTVRSYR
jgi:hypothetical protein